MSTFPMIRLDIEGMKYQILHALTVHQQEITEIVSAYMDNAIKTFDFEKVVHAEIEKLLPELIHQALQSSLQKIIWNGSVKESLEAMAHQAIAKYLKENMQ